jgi:hypothetical protein
MIIVGEVSYLMYPLDSEREDNYLPFSDSDKISCGFGKTVCSFFA